MRDLLLLSGGLDSSALCYWLKPRLAVTIDYGQSAANAEIHASARIAETTGVKHLVIRIDGSTLGMGTMSGSPPMMGLAPTPEWWPFRNQLLLTIAGAIAIKNECDRVIIGLVASDHCHSDGTESFVAAMDALMSAQEGSVRVVAPALKLETPALIRRSGIPRPILAWTHSCHISDFACGDCRGCRKHFQSVRTAFGDNAPTAVT